MDHELFNKIMDFAIRREKEAIEFYNSLQSMAHLSSQREALHALENTEARHMKTLKKIKAKGMKAVSVKHVTDMMISDTLVEQSPSPDMSYQDILIMAMKEEEKAVKLYTMLARGSSDPEVKLLFEGLATEEAEHKLMFETMYDSDILTED